MLSGSFVMLSKTSWNVFVPHDNVTLTLKARPHHSCSCVHIAIGFHD